MKTLQMFDRAMCGSSIDPKLAKLAADVAFLKSHEVQRFNLGHQSGAFATIPKVLSEIKDHHRS